MDQSRTFRHDYSYEGVQTETPSDTDGTGYAKSECGDWVRMWIQLDDKGKIADVRFRYFGCADVLATNLVLSVIAKERTLEDARRLGLDDIERKMQVERHDSHCSLLSLRAFQRALEDCLLHSAPA